MVQDFNLRRTRALAPDFEAGTLADSVNHPKIRSYTEMQRNPYRLVVYKFKKEWRWKIIDRNGRNVATGSKGYRRKNDCKRGLLRLIAALSEDRFGVANDWYARER